VSARVCPFCGEQPGAGVFCEACGRNLAGVEQLPTRAEWEGERRPASAGPPGAADALAAFLAAMHDAGDPGAARTPRAEPGFLGRTRYETGWIVRAVDREAQEPGLFVTVDGRLHRVESATRGAGQRARAGYVDLVGAELPVPPQPERLARELAAVLAANGLRR
jgi:hypothetical protein